MPNCKHCDKPANRPRGLCWGCYDNTGIRDQYAPRAGYYCHVEPTQAEIDALVAEQMNCLPPWWNESKERADVFNG